MTEEQLAEFQQKMLELGESITKVCETFEVMLDEMASQMTEFCIALNQQVADICLEYGVSNIDELVYLVYKVKEQGEYDET